MGIVVSNSETDTWQTCQRKWYYGFALGVRPRKDGKALSYGILGHLALETYYKALKGGADWIEAYNLATAPIVAHIQDDTDVEDGGQKTSDTASVVMDRFTRYVKYWQPDNFNILAVEEKFITPLDPVNDIDFALTFDMLVEMTSGPYKGEVIIMDHKWCYNKWTKDELDMHPQMPKYIWAMRQHGYDIKRGIVNQIRWRTFKNKKFDVPTNLFFRDTVEFKDIEIDDVMRDQLTVARDIDVYAGQPVASTATMVTRSRSRWTCSKCPYKLPCKMELEGRDASTTLAIAFKPTTYGYRTEIDDDT